MAVHTYKNTPGVLFTIGFSVHDIYHEQDLINIGEKGGCDNESKN